MTWKSTLRVYAPVFLLLLAWTQPSIAADLEAGDTLPRIPGAVMFGPKTVWTQGSTADYVFHPLSAPMASDDIISVRVDLLLDQDTGNCSARPALRYGSDGTNWDSSKEILGSYISAPQISYGGAYVDLTSLGVTPKAMVQFGVQVKNSCGTATEFCNAQLRMQIKRS